MKFARASARARSLSLFSLSLSLSLSLLCLMPHRVFPVPQVRILDNEAATGAVPRVMIEFIDTQTGSRWTTAAADSNIVTASMNALVDGIEYMLEHRSTFVEREN